MITHANEKYFLFINRTINERDKTMKKLKKYIFEVDYDVEFV